MSGFYGQYHTTMDDKGRFALPAKLRNLVDENKKPLLDGELILTKGLEGCLSLYSNSEWEEVQKRLSPSNFTKRDFRFYSRQFYSLASIVTPDRNGRILIPSHLIKEASLEKELLVIGVNRLIEIWHPELYRYYLKQFSVSFEEVAERLYTTGDEQKE